ncbi:MAG: hypothetical protein MK066_08165 [Crocinitomicaceae bacterium]|nr:hypothetical protein [Crocinitomicaceae bacterium]
MYKSQYLTQESESNEQTNQSNSYVNVRLTNNYKTIPKKKPRYTIDRKTQRLRRLINREMTRRKSDGTFPSIDEAFTTVTRRVQNRKWYRKGETRRLGDGSESAHKSSTTGWTVKNYQGKTKNISLPEVNITPPGGLFLPSNGTVFNRDILSGKGLTDEMSGTVTVIVGDNGEPDIFTLTVQTIDGPMSQTINTDPTGDPLSPNFRSFSIPLSQLTSPIISFSAIPTRPGRTPAESVYNVAITVNGNATLVNSISTYGINGISNDDSKVKRLNKDFLNDNQTLTRTTRKQSSSERKKTKREKAYTNSRKRKAKKKELDKEKSNKRREAYLKKHKRRALRK